MGEGRGGTFNKPCLGVLVMMATVVVEVEVLVDMDAEVLMEVVTRLLNETAPFPSFVFAHAVLIWLQ